MPTMHIREELDERMIALGYAKRTQRITFVNEAVELRLEREEERRRKKNR